MPFFSPSNYLDDVQAIKCVSCSPFLRSRKKKTKNLISEIIFLYEEYYYVNNDVIIEKNEQNPRVVLTFN